MGVHGEVESLPGQLDGSGATLLARCFGERLDRHAGDPVLGGGSLTREVGVAPVEYATPRVVPRGVVEQPELGSDVAQAVETLVQHLSLVTARRLRLESSVDLLQDRIGAVEVAASIEELLGLDDLAVGGVDPIPRRARDGD